MLRQVKEDEPRPLSWYLDCGSMEWLAESNRNLAAALEARGAPVKLTFRNAGHNWVNWRNGIAEGLRFALAP